MRTRYQQGNLQLDKRKNGPDVWVYRWREYAPAGKVNRRGEMIGTVDQYPTKAEARRACEHLQLTANSENPTSRTIGFGALLDRYVAEEMPERHSTNLAYRSYIETHIRPKWADWPLRKLSSKGAPFTIEQWLKTLDLAPKTKGNIRNVMAVIFNCAMRWGLIDLGVNPLALVRVKGISRRQTEPRILNSEEIQALIAGLAEPCRTSVIVALSSGLRCSELFALKWLVFDWKQLTVLVRRAIVDGVVGDVKTKYSQSGLPLDPALAEILFNWKRASEFAQEGDWVFASPQKAGTLPLRSSSMLATQIKPAAKAAILGDDIGWHTFRHTYSSLLRQLGVDIKVQQELLRHADIRTTMNVYTQAVSDQKRSAHSGVVRIVLPVKIGSELQATGHFGTSKAG
jgi:integrase